MPLANWGLGQQLSPSTGEGSLPVSTLGPGDTFSQPQGTTRRYLVTLVDPQSGAALSSSAYGSGTGLRAFIWEGGDGAALSSPTVAWDDPTAPSVIMEVDPSHLASLAIQPYPVRIEADRSGAWQSVWDGWVDVNYEPATSATPYAPGTYQEMLNKGGDVVKQFLTADERAGFLEQRSEAWKWLRQVILAHYRPPGGNRCGPGYITSLPGYWASPDYPNPIVAGYLDAGKLLYTDQVREILARKALAFVFERQQDPQWMPYARRQHQLAENQVMSLVAGIDLVGSGFPSIVINCGYFNTRDI